MNFPHLDDTKFPHLDTVDVFKFHNDFDYARYDDIQMIIRVLNVPWDLGEVHVGNRTVAGIGNVVKFENDEARDAWFASKRYAETPEQAASGNYDGFVWRTKYREFHDEDEIEIELPFDIAARYNYITVEYVVAPSPDYPVDYESERGLLKWFYFSRAVESLAVNCTRCILRRDTWSTYINRITIPYMILDRGHAPLAAAATVDEYLSNPLARNKYLLTPDIDYNAGNSNRTASAHSIVLNSEAYYACIVTTANVYSEWGSSDAATWTTPANVRNYEQGQPSANVFAVPVNRLNNLLDTINATIPQFIQTVQAVFFVSHELVTLGTEFTFCGESCVWIEEKKNRKTLVTLNKAAFGYDSKYANLAKLYTFPYAKLVIADESGNASIINVEETDGSIDLDYKLSFAWPWINIEGHLLGIGAGSSSNITFQNLTSHSFTIGGQWFEYLKLWQIPTFALTQSARDVANYSSFYDRQQSYLENATTLTNALASNATAFTNALESNATAKTNADAAADNMVANMYVTNAANVAINDRSLQSVSSNTTYNNALGGYNALVSNKLTRDTTNASIDYEIQSAAIGAAGSAITAVAGALANPTPAGIAGSLIGGAVSAGTTIAQTNASVHLSEVRAELAVNANNAGVMNTTQNNRDIQGVQENDMNTKLQINNDTAETETLNNATLQKNNATRDKTTADANANRDKTTADANANRDKATADAAIVAAFDQAALGAPYTYGNYSAGETSTTRPLGIFANVVTQPIDAIEQAGDYFLKYGYAYKGNWNFTTFNVMPKFSYWRCDDLAVRGLDVPDLYMDEIRFFLLGGVTVWRRPEDIGNTSIYENEVA